MTSGDFKDVSTSYPSTVLHPSKMMLSLLLVKGAVPGSRCVGGPTPYLKVGNPSVVGLICAKLRC